MYLEIASTITFAFFIYIFVKYLAHLSKLKDFPPGPFPLPVVGNLHLLGRQAPMIFKDLSKEYGDVFGISLGSKRVVVINAIEPARDSLIQKGADFAGRPTDNVITRGYKDIAFADYGTMWKTLRKVAHSSLKMYGTGMGKLEALVFKETEELFKRLDSKIGQAFNPRDDIGVHSLFSVDDYNNSSTNYLFGMYFVISDFEGNMRVYSPTFLTG